MDPSIAALLKKHMKIMQSLDKRLNFALVNSQKMAAQSVMTILHNIRLDTATMNILNRMQQYANQTGRMAAKAFATDWRKQTPQTLSSLRQMANLLDSVQRRASLLASRQIQGFSKAATAALQLKKALEDTEKQTKLNDVMRGELLKRMRANRGMTTAERDELKSRVKMLKEANKQMKSLNGAAKDLPSRLRVLDMMERRQDLMDKINAPINRIRHGAELAKTAVGQMFTNPKAMIAGWGTAIFAGLFMLFKMLFNQMAASIAALREYGFVANQISEQLKNDSVSTRAWIALQDKGLKSLNREDTFRNFGALRRELGGTKLVTQDLVESASLLTHHFQLSSDEAAKIQGTFYRLSKFSAETAINITRMATDLAYTHDLSPGDLLRSMAENAEELAKAGYRTADAFARANIMSMRTGVNMSTISGLADRFATDLEGTLTSMARLNAFAPGIDLTEAMFAAQFGNTEQFMMAMQNAVGGLQNFDMMPRGQKLGIAGSLGMSVSELTALISGKDLEKLQMKSYDNIAAVATETHKLASGESSILNALQNILLALRPVQWLAEKLASGTTLLGRMLLGGDVYPGKPDFSNVRSGVGKPYDPLTPAKRYHDGGYIDINTAPRYHNGLTAKEIPAILQKGEAVLSQKMLVGLSKIMGVMSSMSKMGDTISKKTGGFLGSIFGKSAGNKAGGFLDGIFGGAGKKAGGFLGSIMSGGGIGKKVSGFLGGLFGGGKSTSPATLGINMGANSGLMSMMGGGGIGNFLGNTGIGKILGGSGIGKTISGLFGGGGIKSKLSGMAGKFLGKIPGLGGIMDKIPGGGIVKGLLGGGLKGGMKGILNMGASKLIGAALGGPIGMAAMAAIQKIPLVGKFMDKISGGAVKLLSKTGLGTVAKGVKKVANVGKKLLGGLFGKKKKKKPAPAPTLTSPEMPMGGDMFSAMFGGGAGLDPVMMSAMMGGFGGGMSSMGGMGMGGLMPMGQSSPAISTGKIETLLTDLIAAVKAGQVIKMDGREVGATITEAFARGG